MLDQFTLIIDFVPIDCVNPMPSVPHLHLLHPLNHFTFYIPNMINKMKK